MPPMTITHGKDDKRLRVVLIAHDARKDEMSEWAAYNRGTLAGCDIYATATTGAHVAQKLDLPITMLLSGPLGGDAQVGALISEQRVDVVFFFWDPLTPQPHDVDVKASLRLAVLYDVPIACNRRSADLLISSPLFSDLAYHRKLSISIRSIRPDDLARVRAVFERTSSEDRYCRFFHIKEIFDDAELRRFVEPGNYAIGFLAESGGVVGMAHAWIDERGAAELGIIVCRDQRRLGVGRELVAALLRALRARGVFELYAYALVENAAFDALACSVGMTRAHFDGGVVTYRVPMEPDERAGAAVA